MEAGKKIPRYFDKRFGHCREPLVVFLQSLTLPASQLKPM